jgi:hypothetical protein
MTRFVVAVLLALGLVAGANAAGNGSISGTVFAGNPLSVSLTLSTPFTSVGGSVTASATVLNRGSAPVANVVVVLSADPNLTIAGGVETRTLGTIPGNSSASASWSVCALAAGGYVVLARATTGSFQADSPGQLLNVSTASGQCPKDAIATLPAGGTLSTDREGDGATAASPVETAVTTPFAGTVVIAEAPAPSSPTAFAFLGWQVVIRAPLATAASPLRIAFRLDPTIVLSPAPIQVFRNGVHVPDCAGLGAVPDPCVSSRTRLPDGDFQLVVLTSAASTWTFGTPIVTRGGIAAALTTSNGHVAGLLAGSDGRTLVGVFSFDTFLSTKAVALAISGRKAWYAGLGTDGRPFLVYVEDNSANGRTDVFRLWIGGVEQTSDGKLAKGNVGVTS